MRSLEASEAVSASDSLSTVMSESLSVSLATSESLHDSMSAALSTAQGEYDSLLEHYNDGSDWAVLAEVDWLSSSFSSWVSSSPAAALACALLRIRISSGVNSPVSSSSTR